MEISRGPIWTQNAVKFFHRFEKLEKLALDTYVFVGENPRQVYRSTPSVTAVADFQYKMSVKRTPTEAGNRERVQTAHHRAA